MNGVKPPHQCELSTCTAAVPRRPGESEKKWRRRRYCNPVHSLDGRVEKTRVWAGEQRTCERVGCGEVYVPTANIQRYHDHACSVLARKRGAPRETKMCACPCGEMIERRAGEAPSAWAERRFKDAEHRRRGGYTTNAKKKAPAAVGEPGAARAGRRTAPSPVPSKDRRPAPQPVRSVFGDGVPAAPWRPPVPVVERVVRVAARPSFGLSRRSA